MVPWGKFIYFAAHHHLIITFSIRWFNHSAKIHLYPFSQHSLAYQTVFFMRMHDVNELKRNALVSILNMTTIAPTPQISYHSQWNSYKYLIELLALLISLIKINVAHSCTQTLQRQITSFIRFTLLFVIVVFLPMTILTHQITAAQNSKQSHASNG